jgi:oligoendopeptidase F
MSQQTSAASVCWRLDDLYHGVDDPRITHDLDQALTRAQAFEAAHRGKIAAGPSTELLRDALIELESLSEQMDRPVIYAHLRHAAQTDDPQNGALLAKAREAATRINQHLIFFDLEWVQTPESVVATLLADARLAKFRHYLDHKRAWRPHLLSEPEEKLLDRKSLTGRGAFVRLFDETVAGLTFPFDHQGQVQHLPLAQINAKLYDPVREVRRASAEGMTRGLRDNRRLLTYIFNNLILEHKQDCELRHFDEPMAPRHLSNQITGPVVDALMTATERRHGCVARYYRLKSRLLGVAPLLDYDRYAPVFADLPGCDWPLARQIVAESYQAFSPKAGEVVGEFFAKHWIDAEPRPGKRGGAFCSGTVPSLHPVVLMNFTDRLRDVMTLAHELGHGLHFYLAQPVGYLQHSTPLTTAEMASVFGEMLTFRRLLEIHTDPRIRLGLLCSKIEDAFATVFRQVVLTRFELSAHRARDAEGELTTERLNELWIAANQPMFGDSVQLTQEYGWWWMYIGHFIHTPFYCYAYAFGELLVLALFQKYKQEGEAFVPKYLDLLAAGGSDAPDRLLAKLGVDVNDPGFWELGLRLLEDMVTEAEQLAK